MAYTATVTLDVPRAQRISRDLTMVLGKCAVSSYDTTGVEITDITKYFRKILRVNTDGFSSNGYMVRWNTTDKCFHAFYPTKAITPAGTIPDHDHTALTVNASEVAADSTTFVSVTDGAGTAQAGIKVSNAGGGVDTALTSSSKALAFTGTAVSAQAGTEVADGVDIGEVNFTAIGLH